MRQEIAFFDQSKTGELMNRLSADTTGRREGGREGGREGEWA
ncbi:Hypothetical protein NocV09_10100070, partial [Nannochloropsis oceanica]